MIGVTKRRRVLILTGAEVNAIWTSTGYMLEQPEDGDGPHGRARGPYESVRAKIAEGNTNPVYAVAVLTMAESRAADFVLGNLLNPGNGGKERMDPAAFDAAWRARQKINQPVAHHAAKEPTP